MNDVQILPVRAQSIYMVSERSNFSSMTTLSTITMIWNTKSQTYFHYHHPLNLSGRRVLVLVHGYNTSYAQVWESLHFIAKRTQSSYDTVIAYLYPCQQAPNTGNPIVQKKAYAKGRIYATFIGTYRFSRFINGILATAKRVDVAAHSMGARTVMSGLSSLKYPVNKKMGNLFLVAGAENDHTFLDCAGPLCSDFRIALHKIQKIYNIYSCKDEILPFHAALIGERAMGRLGPLEQSLIAANVKFINATNVVDTHSGYLTNNTVIGFLNSVAKKNDAGYFLQGRYFSLENSLLKRTRGLAPCSFGADVILGTVVKGVVDGIVKVGDKVLTVAENVVDGVAEGVAAITRDVVDGVGAITQNIV